MTRNMLVIGTIIFAAVLQMPAQAGDATCSFDRASPECGMVTADQARGDFRGLIMVRDDPSVLDRAATAGTKPGCADCVWEVILACAANRPQTGADASSCAAATHAAGCRAGQSLYRLYLTTDALRDTLEGTLCLGDIDEVLAVGNIAAADVARYLRDVTPPLVDITMSPPRGVPANLPAYFAVSTPTALRPVPFGGPLVHETITLTPAAYAWDWGDGTTSGWTTDAGGPYPTGTLTHTYLRASRLDGALTTRWGGTYTVTVAGDTFGPYAAIGTVTRTQPFAVVVLAARSETVSHG